MVTVHTSLNNKYVTVLPSLRYQHFTHRKGILVKLTIVYLDEQKRVGIGIGIFVCGLVVTNI